MSTLQFCRTLSSLVNIWPSYCQNKKGAIFMTHCSVECRCNLYSRKRQCLFLTCAVAMTNFRFRSVAWRMCTAGLRLGRRRVWIFHNFRQHAGCKASLVSAPPAGDLLAQSHTENAQVISVRSPCSHPTVFHVTASSLELTSCALDRGYM